MDEWGSNEHAGGVHESVTLRICSQSQSFSGRPPTRQQHVSSRRQQALSGISCGLDSHATRQVGPAHDAHGIHTVHLHSSEALPTSSHQRVTDLRSSPQQRWSV